MSLSQEELNQIHREMMELGMIQDTTTSTVRVRQAGARVGLMEQMGNSNRVVYDRGSFSYNDFIQSVENLQQNAENLQRPSDMPYVISTSGDGVAMLSNGMAVNTGNQNSLRVGDVVTSAGGYVSPVVSPYTIGVATSPNAVTTVEKANFIPMKTKRIELI